MVDLLLTLLDIVGGKPPATVAGLPVPPLHGQTLVPAFVKDGTVKHDYLWWNHEGNRAIRIGDWKLVADHKKAWELFDLNKDRSETKDLAAKNPEKVKEMEQAWNKQASEFYVLSLQDPSVAARGKKKGKANQEPVE